MRDRLLAMLLLVAMLHAIVLLGVSFTAAPAAAPATPAARRHARDQRGAGGAHQRTCRLPGSAHADRRRQHRRSNVSPARPAAAPLNPQNGNAARSQDAATANDSADRQLLTSSGASPDIRYVGEAAATAARQRFAADAGRHRRRCAQWARRRCRTAAQRQGRMHNTGSRPIPAPRGWRRIWRPGSARSSASARSTFQRRPATAGLSGSPVVEVQIGANGRLLEASVRRSSGHGSLDQQP